MVPPAPPRFSTTTCWPSDLLILSATMRPSASLPPPGGNGMTSVTGRTGYAWAAAGRGASDDTTRPLTRLMKARRFIQCSASQPTNLGFIAILELRDTVAVAERERNIVRAGQQAFLAELVDFEPVGRAVGSCHRLRFKIDGDAGSGRLLQQGAERRNRLGIKRHRQQAILEAVVEKDIAEARRHHGPDTVIVERPDRMLARRPTAEIAVRDHNAGIPVDVPVEHEIRLRCAAIVEAQIMEQEMPEAVAALAPQETRRDDLVRVDVRHADRRGRSVQAKERLHHGLVANRRTSVSLPAMAAAAAIAGLIRWVRAPLPWRPTKLRLDVEAQRSPGATRSPFIPTHIEHPASRHSKPARLKIASMPSASACAFTRPEPGTTIAGTTARRPSSTFAAARRSSTRLLVHEPMNTRSMAISASGVPGRRSI